jgi:hypothetical protein
MACELKSRAWEVVFCNLVACGCLGNEKFGALLMLFENGVGRESDGKSLQNFSVVRSEGLMLVCM